MPVTIGVLRECAPQETRVSLVPEVATKFAALGARVLIERGAGAPAQFPDALYKQVEWADTSSAVLDTADILLTVQPLTLAQIGALKAGACEACRSKGAARRAHHPLRDGVRAAHFARPVDGRAVFTGSDCRLQGGADRG